MPCAQFLIIDSPFDVSNHFLILKWLSCSYPSDWLFSFLSVLRPPACWLAPYSSVLRLLSAACRTECVRFILRVYLWSDCVLLRFSFQCVSEERILLFHDRVCDHWPSDLPCDHLLVYHLWVGISLNITNLTWFRVLSGVIWRSGNKGLTRP